MRDVLVRFARDVELPRFTRRIENVRRLLFIGNCLSASLVDSVRSTVAEETHVAVVASGCSGAPEGVTTVHSNVTVAGTLDRILLPTGWAEGIVGHCVLDELPTPGAAFTERARVIGGTRQLERAAEKGHRHRADGHWPEDAPREVAGPKEQCGADNRNQEVQDEGERVAWSSRAQRVAPLAVRSRRSTNRGRTLDPQASHERVQCLPRSRQRLTPRCAEGLRCPDAA